MGTHPNTRIRKGPPLKQPLVDTLCLNLLLHNYSANMDNYSELAHTYKTPARTIITGIITIINNIHCNAVIDVFESVATVCCP